MLMQMASLLAAAMGLLAGDGDWSQWRGPQRDGVADASLAPTAWPEALTRRWSVETGRSHASPVVWGDAVFVFVRDGEREVAQCHDLGTGALRWARAEEVEVGVNPYAEGHGRWPRATPLVSEAGLVSVGITGLVRCRSLEEGALRWQDAPASPPDTSQLFCGTAPSPIAWRDRVVVQRGDDRGGEFVALSLRDGAVVWRTRTKGPGYASPILIAVPGESDGSDPASCLVGMSQESVLGLDPDDGEVLWSVPFVDRWNENIVTPLFDRGRLLYAGVRRGCFCLGLRAGGPWSTEVHWGQREVPLYMSSPVVVGDRWVGHSNRKRGQLVALDPATGEPGATLEANWGDNAALVRLGEALLALGTEGELRVLRLGAEAFEVHRCYTVADGPTWSHPVPVAGGLLVQHAAGLTRWDYH